VTFLLDCEASSCPFSLLSKMASEIFLLTLDDSGSPEVSGSYILLPPPVNPYTLRFAIEGASSVCRKGSLRVNVPEKGQDFSREKFREYKYIYLCIHHARGKKNFSYIPL